MHIFILVATHALNINRFFVTFYLSNSLKKGRDNVRVAKLMDSPNMPEAEASFAITDGGIDDVMN